MELPALQIVNGRGFVFLAGTMNDKRSKKVGPSGLEEDLPGRKVPNLVLVALFVRCTTQFRRRFGEVEAPLFGIGTKNSEFLAVIGRTALKARSCFAAASELFNVCFERDSRSSVA